MPHASSENDKKKNGERYFATTLSLKQWLKSQNNIEKAEHCWTMILKQI